MPLKVLRLVLTLVIAASIARCSTAATLTLADRSEVTGKILRADADSVYVETAEGTKKIASLSIADVEHPGKGLILIGGGLLASGLILTFGGEQKTCQADCSFPEPYNPVGLAATAVGGGVFLTGAYFWYGSRMAMEPPPAQPRQPTGFGIEFHYRF